LFVPFTRNVFLLLLALGGTLAVIAAPAAELTVVNIEAVGTAFRVTLPDGATKEGTALAGAVLTFDVNGTAVRIRIASIEADAGNKAVLLHDFRFVDNDVPLCTPDPQGRQLGFPLAGRTAADGRFVAAAPGIFELICPSGAQGKCVRFGYHPWENGTDGKSMRDYYNACVRLVRADYCGDGRAYTREGTSIDLWDDRGIQKSESGGDASYSFEAAWGPDGAVCVARSRIPDNITLDGLKAACPRLARMPSCSEATGRTGGALLFNRSR
jgi:hypothetical protein